ncbi:hypothetical protein XELAEV_18001281mg [Xenopus laevis]|uniref:Uncharacterized protein n=1 Tax=Xenopus laevis TaxID=8355 RepID=A0A974BPB1_XENLA|nr:hypothetical protein XELAEV_18001281mg [Xenopus laevis]
MSVPPPKVHLWGYRNKALGLCPIGQSHGIKSAGSPSQLQPPLYTRLIVNVNYSHAADCTAICSACQ